MEKKKRKRRLSRASRSWSVLNYAVCEPNEWTARLIAEDLGDKFNRITSIIKLLLNKGYVVKDAKVGKGRALLPTPAGVEALRTAV
tara:strand:+ start:1215 stop:1472 length:258 start_codon:yes stop_codon:yes gene_type:complete